MRNCIDSIYINIFILLLLLNDPLVELDLFLDLCILLLLHDQLLHKQLSIILLSPILSLQLLVLLHECSILIVYPLSNICNQFQMMMQLILSILQISSLIPFLSLPLLNFLLHLGEFTVKLSNYVFLLLFLQLLYLRLDSINVFMKLILESPYNSNILLPSLIFITISHSQLSLKIVNVLSVFLLSFHITLLPSEQVFMQLLVFLYL